MSESKNGVKAKQPGRNEPCPCGSGRKYKRCCGVGADPVLTEANPTSKKLSKMQKRMNGMGGGMPGMENMDPQMMMQMSQALQKLPRHQLQKLQSLMQRAMSGQDITAEAQQFENSLPPEFKEMMAGFQGMPGMDAMGAQTPQGEAAPTADEPLDLDQAKKLVQDAVKDGTLSAEQAEALLQGDSSQEEKTNEKSESSSKLGRFWKSITGKGEK